MMFDQSEPQRNAILRTVHNVITNNSVAGMGGAEHKGISDIDFSNASFADGTIQAPGAEAFDIQHENLFDLMRDHVTQKNALRAAELGVEMYEGAASILPGAEHSHDTRDWADDQHGEQFNWE